MLVGGEKKSGERMGEVRARMGAALIVSSSAKREGSISRKWTIDEVVGLWVGEPVRERGKGRGLKFSKLLWVFFNVLRKESVLLQPFSSGNPPSLLTFLFLRRVDPKFLAEFLRE